MTAKIKLAVKLTGSTEYLRLKCRCTSKQFNHRYPLFFSPLPTPARGGLVSVAQNRGPLHCKR